MVKLLKDAVALRVAELPTGASVPFDIEPDAALLAAMAEKLGVVALRKVTFRGKLAPLGRRDWQLNAELGATALQQCVATLDDVTSRVDVPVERHFLSDMPRPEELDATPEDGVEMPDDDHEEPLGEVIDLGRVLIEALALALPDYPRKEDAEPVSTVVAPPGETPLSDSDLKPFAGLADLKAKLQGES